MNDSLADLGAIISSPGDSDKLPAHLPGAIVGTVLASAAAGAAACEARMVKLSDLDFHHCTGAVLIAGLLI